MAQLIVRPGTVNGHENSSCIIKKHKDGEAASLVSQETRKRVCPFEEVKIAKRGTPGRKRSDNCIVRWSPGRLE